MILRLSAIALLLVGLTSEAVAQPNSLIDYYGPRVIGIGESNRAGAIGATSIKLNPAGLALSRQLVFDASYGFRAEDSASIVMVSACDSTVAIPGCFYYQYFSAEPTIGGNDMKRRAHEWGYTSSRLLTPQIVLGLTGRYYDYNSDLTGEEDSSGFSFDAGLIFVASPAIKIAAVGYNLIGEESPQYPRAVATGLSLQAGPMVALSMDALWNLDTADGESTGRYGGGVQLFLRSADKLNGYPIRAGAVYDAQLGGTYLTGGIGYANPRFGIDIGARRQVDGDGDELLILAGLRVYGPQI